LVPAAWSVTSITSTICGTAALIATSMPVGRHRRIDLPVEHLLDASGDWVAPALVWIVDPKRTAKRRRVEVDHGPLQVGGTAWLDQQPKVGRLDHDVRGRGVFRCDEIQLVHELTAPATSDRDAKARIQMPALGADGIDLRLGGRRHRDCDRHCRHCIHGQLRGWCAFFC
jgi:hypothetical protein